MDLTEVKFVVQLSAYKERLSEKVIRGYFSSVASAEAALLKNGLDLYKEFGFTQFVIEEVLMGTVFIDNSGCASQKWFFVSEDRSLIVEDVELNSI